MKILFWSSSFWPAIGGVETQALLFLLKMKERGHQFLVITQNEGTEEFEGIEIRRFDFKGLLFEREKEILHRLRKYLDQVLSTFKPDLVHLNGCVGESPIVFSMFRSLFSMPIVLTNHAPHYGFPMQPIVRKVCSQVDRVCCVSKWVMRETASLIPEIKEKMRLIYNGIPPFSLPPAPLTFSPPLLLYLGRLTQEKGIRCAAAAFSLLKKRGSTAQLVIGGEGEERAALSSIDTDPSVTFIGAVEREAVPHLLNRASIVLVPSYFESFGLVALEAMQMGRPVIASNVGGLPEIISNERIGVLVPPKNPEALSDAIEKLLQNRAEATRMGAEARQYALSHFTLEQNVDSYEALYRELV